MSPRLTLEWKVSTLPGCFGWPCEVARHDDHAVRVWRTDPGTQMSGVGLCCWKIDDGANGITHGNIGTAKTTAPAALMRLVDEEGGVTHG